MSPTKCQWHCFLRWMVCLNLLSDVCLWDARLHCCATASVSLFKGCSQKSRNHYILHRLHAGSPGQTKDHMSSSGRHRCCNMPYAGQGCTLRPWSSDSCPILAACTASYSCLRLCISFSSASLSPCITSPASTTHHVLMSASCTIAGALPTAALPVTNLDLNAHFPQEATFE